MLQNSDYAGTSPPASTRSARLVSATSSETLVAALRRALVPLAIAVTVGVIAANVGDQLNGSRYRAESAVLLTATDIGNAVTGFQPGLVDPGRVEETGLALAGSSKLYVSAAARQRLAPRVSADELQSATTATTGGNNVITFAVSNPEAAKARELANVVASSYVRWRRALAAAGIQAGIAELQQELRQLPSDSKSSSPLRQYLRDLQLLDKLNTGNAVFFQPAVKAVKTAPAPMRATVFGILIGVLIAIALSVVREAVDTKVRSEEDVEDMLGVPILASVRKFPRDTRLVVYNRHEVSFGDTFALIAASLEANAQGPISIAVTSAGSGEGKTSITANLAVVAARRGKRVVLVDFDLRRSQAGATFGIPPSAKGIREILGGRASLSETLWDVSIGLHGPQVRPMDPRFEWSRRPGDASGWLLVVPAGVPSEPVTSRDGMAALLEELKSRADIVIVDTPPALAAVEMTELGRIVSHVIVVVRNGTTSRRALRQLERQMPLWTADSIGAVFTAAPVLEETSYPYGL